MEPLRGFDKTCESALNHKVRADPGRSIASGDSIRLGSALALEVGALNPQEVAAWADAMVAAEEDFDPRLIEVSLAKSVAEAISALNVFGPAPSRPRVAVRVFAFFHAGLASGMADHQKIAKALYDMANADYVPAPDLAGPMLTFWDELDLAIGGILDRSPETVKADMERFLSAAMP